MIDEKEMADARTMEEDMETANNMSGLNKRVVELEAEGERLRKLEAAVVGSWMRACDHRGPWHKALRYPCVKLGYLKLDGHYFELSEEYQDMAKEWIREQDGVD